MIEELHLRARAANHVPLTPVEFLVRAAEIHPDRPAVAWNEHLWDWRGFARMVARFARFLAQAGVRGGDVVSIISSNRPEMLAAHYAVPMLGAVLNTINTRLDEETIGYIVDHSQSRLLIADGGSAGVASAIARTRGIALHQLVSPLGHGEAASGTPVLDIISDDGEVATFDLLAIADEWQPLSLNYTSGTTGRPKGVVYHHRGAYLNALGNVLALGLNSCSVYLWTLPMFHCNGWCHTWAVTAAGGLHVCLDRPDPQLILSEMERRRVTHLACAPVVLHMMLEHPAMTARDHAHRIRIATGGATPTSALIGRLDDLGFEFVHLYGLTESFGPTTVRELGEEARAQSPAAKAALLARQGVRHLTANRVRVVDAGGVEVLADGETMGEITLSGNTLMAGYYRDAEATEKAFAGGAFRTGDLAVRHPDGAIEIRDRSKDIIISGGENISSLEVESVLHRHPSVRLAAVVAAPHTKWGETPVAFIELRDGRAPTPEDLRAFCKAHLAGYKVPTRYTFCDLPKTATGKIQKFALREAARREDDR